MTWTQLGTICKISTERNTIMIVVASDYTMLEHQHNLFLVSKIVINIGRQINQQTMAFETLMQRLKRFLVTKTETNYGC